VVHPHEIARSPNPAEELSSDAQVASPGSRDGLLSVYDEGEQASYVHFHDAQGNVGQVVDLAAASESASMMARYEYVPFRDTTVAAGGHAETNPFRHCTKYCDEKPGLVYFGERYHSIFVCIYVYFICCGTGWADDRAADVSETLATLRNTRMLYDSSGRLARPLFDLLAADDAATKLMCREIDSSPQAASPDYVPVLYAMLGLCKDPATIPWLLQKLDTPDRELVYERWLAAWPAAPTGVVVSPEEWSAHPGLRQPLRREPDWAVLFRQLLAESGNVEQRKRVLRVIVANFGSPAFASVLMDELASKGGDVECKLIALTGLWRMEAPFPDERLVEVLKRSRKEVSHTELVLLYSGMIYHEAFVPELLGIMKGDLGSPPDVESRLRAITLAVQVSGSQQWHQWYADHQGETRRTWLARAVVAVTRGEATPSALDFEQMAMLCSRDPRSLWHVCTAFLCSGDYAAGEDLIGYLIWSYEPATKEARRSLVEQLLSEHSAKLKRETIEFLRGLDLHPEIENWWAWRVTSLMSKRGIDVQGAVSVEP
jgi:hypothetical protein